MTDRAHLDLPSLALIEVASIARGYVVADEMVKKAPVVLLTCEPITPGKFLVLVAGDVADVDEALCAGLAAAGDRVIDKLFLPHAHPDLAPAIRGEARAGAVDSLGIVETTTVAAAILGADAAAKAARVRLTEMRLARGIGGKAFFAVSGPLGEVEAAIDAATGVIAPALLHATEIIAAPHGDLVGKLR